MVKRRSVVKYHHDYSLDNNIVSENKFRLTFEILMRQHVLRCIKAIYQGKVRTERNGRWIVYRIIS